MPKQQIEIDVPEGYEVENIGMLMNCHYDKKYKCVYFKKKQPEFIEGDAEYKMSRPYLNAQIKLLRAMIDSCQELNPWRPIESAKTNGRRLMLWHKYWSGPCCGFYDGSAWKIHSELPPFKYQPTHWMELPELPKEPE